MKRIEFSEQARSDVRRLDKPTAMRILGALHRFADTAEGDVRSLKGTSGEFRLRVGDYRIRFSEREGILRIKRVMHRSEAYR